MIAVKVIIVVKVVAVVFTGIVKTLVAAVVVVMTLMLKQLFGTFRFH